MYKDVLSSCELVSSEQEIEDLDQSLMPVPRVDDISKEVWEASFKRVTQLNNLYSSTDGHMGEITDESIQNPQEPIQDLVVVE